MWRPNEETRPTLRVRLVETFSENHWTMGLRPDLIVGREKQREKGRDPLGGPALLVFPLLRLCAIHALGAVINGDEPLLDVAEHQPQFGAVAAVRALDDGQVTVAQRYTRLRDIGYMLP